MGEIKIDSETAKLVVHTYQKINKLKSLLNNEPYPQMKELLESGTALNEMMNHIIDESTKEGLETKLNTLSAHLNELSSSTDNMQQTIQKQELIDVFEQLKAAISLIQSKING